MIRPAPRTFVSLPRLRLGHITSGYLAPHFGGASTQIAYAKKCLYPATSYTHQSLYDMG